MWCGTPSFTMSFVSDNIWILFVECANRQLRVHFSFFLSAGAYPVSSVHYVHIVFGPHMVSVKCYVLGISNAENPSAFIEKNPWHFGTLPIFWASGLSVTPIFSALYTPDPQSAKVSIVPFVFPALAPVPLPVQSSHRVGCRSSFLVSSLYFCLRLFLFVLLWLVSFYISWARFVSLIMHSNSRERHWFA